MKILALDIETAPMIAYLWQLKQDGYITTDKIVKDGHTLCWAAKWVGETGPVTFDSVKLSSPMKMLKHIHSLLDEADAVLTYNGISFDLPILNKAFIENGMDPPAPYKHIDLIRTARDKFRFSSNKLDWVASHLGLGSKHEHKGMPLWTGCMAGNDKDWATMRRYNIQDVLLLEKLYMRMRPWISSHPSHGALSDRPVCTNCGGKDHQQRGYAITATAKYPRFQCKKCGTWLRGAVNELPKGRAKSILRQA